MDEKVSVGQMYFMKRFGLLHDGMCASDIDAAAQYIPKDGTPVAMMVEEIPMLLVGRPGGVFVATPVETLVNGYDNIPQDFADYVSIAMTIGYPMDELMNLAELSNTSPVQCDILFARLKDHISACAKNFDPRDFKEKVSPIFLG